ncbi:MAG: bifunctional 4-hydroxy-2-oxoglutarate aldolase/2-dehydro-3-deoxy-phosphogluconate aldolase [Spirochaetia bacterium]
MWSKELTESLSKNPIIAVLVFGDPADAVPTAQALVRGGVFHVELALRTAGSMEALKAVIAEVPELVVGVGTVLQPEQVYEIKELGAAFAVSPGFNPRVVEAARDSNLPFAPGVATPSEIEAAYSLGCRLLKLFPAEPLGGIKYLQSVNSAYRHLGLSYIPLGGVTRENMNDWLALPEVLAVGGSWLAPKNLIVNKNWREIEDRARDAALGVVSVQ